MKEKFRYKIVLEYNGTEFCGWQRQANAISVQEILEKSIKEFCGEDASVLGAGRTDAGVHALAQVAHFDLREEKNPGTIARALNHFVRPHRIAIIECAHVDHSFHSRFSAKSRSYLYRILNGRAKAIFEENRAWLIRDPLDLEAMREASAPLVGLRDFTSFRAKFCQADSPVKTLSSLEISVEGDIIEIRLEAPSFLHRMVRNIVGSLVWVGIGKKPASFIKEALEAKDTRAAGPAAPACGLYLTKVKY